MNDIFFTPGPSQLYPTYQFHLQTAMDKQMGSINHRSSAFQNIYQHTDEQLRELLNLPKSHSIFFASSATEIWEKLILNLVENHSFHVTNGSFSSKFSQFAQSLKKSSSQLNVEAGLGFDIDAIQIPEETELICTTQNETSTGVQIPVEDLIKIKEKHPEKLICTDLVSIAPYSVIDYHKMDSSFFSVQKAFGMPPGLGVWIVNEKAISKAEELESKGINVGAHNTISSFYKNYKKFETPSTPNVIAIYILGKIAEDMNNIGIENIRKDIDAKAEMMYFKFNENEHYTPFVVNKQHRSQTIGVFNTIETSDVIIKELIEKGFRIGSGYGKLKANQIRIANFPATSIEQMNDLLSHF